MSLDAKILTGVRFLYGPTNWINKYGQKHVPKKSRAPQMALRVLTLARIREYIENRLENLGKIEKWTFGGTIACNTEKHILWPNFSVLGHYAQFLMRFSISSSCIYRHFVQIGRFGEKCSTNPRKFLKFTSTGSISLHIFRRSHVQNMANKQKL